MMLSSADMLVKIGLTIGMME